MSASISFCLCGGMVDTRDLKSLGLIGRASSSLAVGTRYVKNKTYDHKWVSSFILCGFLTRKRLLCISQRGQDHEVSD